MTDTAIWRQILNDSQHPLNNVAWLLFRTPLNFRSVERIPEEKREDAAQLALTILQTPELYGESALGHGAAPENSLEILAQWLDVRAIPIVLDMMAELGEESAIWEWYYGPMEYLSGTTEIETSEVFLQSAEKHFDNLSLAVTITEFLIFSGDDPRIYDYVKRVFERLTDDDDIRLVADNLLLHNLAVAKPYLQEKFKQPRYAANRKWLKDQIDYWEATFEEDRIAEENLKNQENNQD